MREDRKGCIERFGLYFRDLADHLGLKDWTINLTYDPPKDHDHKAEVWNPPGRKFANIALSDHFLFEADRESQRQTAVHELIHNHWAVVDDYLWKVLDRDEQTAFDILREYAIDGLAEAIAPHLPLPPEGI